MTRALPHRALVCVGAVVVLGALACRGDSKPSGPASAPAPKTKGRVHISLDDVHPPDPDPGGTPREAAAGPAREIADADVRRACGKALPLPRDTHYVAPGLVACFVGRAEGGLRQLAFAPNGDLFGATVAGAIYRFRDVDGDGAFASGAPETVPWASSGGNGNSVHVDVERGYVYASSPDGVVRFRWSPDADEAGALERVVVEQPSDGGHGRHTNHVYGDFLYVQLGSAGNAVNPMSPAYDTARSLVKRFDLTRFDPAHPFRWADGEVFAVGLRNTVGFTRDSAGRMYGVVNGLDDVTWRGRDVHGENPGEAIVRLEKGKRFGYPFCFTAQRLVGDDGVVVPAGTSVKNGIFASPHDDAWCAANADPPATFVQAHSAPLDITFFDGPEGRLPSRWRGGAFVTMHGSWDRRPSTGYKVVWVPFAPDGTAPMPRSTATETHFPYEVVLGGGSWRGHVDGVWGWQVGIEGEGVVRPVGVAVSPRDGSLFVSSDAGSTVFRIGSPR